ncbi:HvfC family RiPP maturation protein [Faucicola boevrei]|uniref:HvfC family RiPP maturation protein n=1 Tax=Faucicola boevrei TaxID=346665 RepID=UPI0003736051|nr:putative DNA-binding domain-containing protein [Moraxella boevrei]
MTNYPTAPRLSRPLNKLFVAHQQAFATFLRQQRFYNESVVLADTADQPLLDDLSPRIGKLYRSLVYNNVSSFINQCFPVCQTMVDSRLWQTLIQLFIASNHLKSPYFVEINQQFCAFLAETAFDKLDIPPFLGELAHYEWIELLVEMLPDEPFCRVLPTLYLNPTLQVLHYDWAVHNISADRVPDATATFLLVYRQETAVKFMQTNSLTYLLLDFLQATLANHHTFEDPNALLTAFAEAYELPTLSLDEFEQWVNQFSQHHIFCTTEAV